MVFRQHRRGGTEIGLIVEGTSDCETIPILIEKVLGSQGINPVIRKQILRRGTLLKNPRKVEAIINLLLSSHPHLKKLLVCVDSECTSPADLEPEVKKVERQLAHINPRPKYILVIHALESWLMADERALTKVLGAGVKVQPVTHPEGICKPRAQLSRIFSKSGKDFNHMRDDPKLAGP